MRQIRYFGSSLANIEINNLIANWSLSQHCFSVSLFGLNFTMCLVLESPVFCNVSNISFCRFFSVHKKLLLAWMCHLAHGAAPLTFFCRSPTFVRSTRNDQPLRGLCFTTSLLTYHDNWYKTTMPLAGADRTIRSRWQGRHGVWRVANWYAVSSTTDSSQCNTTVTTHRGHLVSESVMVTVNVNLYSAIVTKSQMRWAWARFSGAV